MRHLGRKRMVCALVAALCLMGAASAHADDLSLANGDRFTGRLLGVAQGCCEFEVPYGSPLRIPWSDVACLRTGAAFFVELASGERLFGAIEGDDAGALCVASGRLGSVTVRLDEIASIRAQAPVRAEVAGMAKVAQIPEVAEVDLREIRGRGTTPSEKTPPTQISDPPPDKVGEKPEESPKTFLRESAVLLGPGQIELDLSMTYLRSQAPLLRPFDDGAGGLILAVVEDRRRELTFSPAVRVGLFDRAEGEISVPVRWSQLERILQPNVDSDTRDEAGIGDVGARFKYLLRAEDGWPDLIGSVSVTAPTGDDPYGVDEVGLGSGHWIVGGGLTAIRSFDPISVFGGVQYGHLFERRYSGSEIEPGEQVTYFMGMAFAVNRSITLSTEFSGSVVTETEVDGENVPGSFQEPMSIRMGMTHQLGRDSFWEPSIRFGLNDDAADTILGLAWVKRF